MLTCSHRKSQLGEEMQILLKLCTESSSIIPSADGLDFRLLERDRLPKEIWS